MPSTILATCPRCGQRRLVKYEHQRRNLCADCLYVLALEPGATTLWRHQS